MAGRIVVISDRIADAEEGRLPVNLLEAEDAPVKVEGGYLERLPLSLIAAGRFSHAEIWHHVAYGTETTVEQVSPCLIRRGFPLHCLGAPRDNRAMIDHLIANGPPNLLCVYGLGVSKAVLDAAAGSVKVYNSIDAPALRIPADVSACFDMVLTGADWQTREVQSRHPGMLAPVLPVGPEFAAIDQFHPSSATKEYDLVYVAAAQPYKRHDILFDAIERLEGTVNALCVFGYGELAENLRHEAGARGLPIDFVMPPVLPFDEVNRLMNRARIGIVAGVDDGAPAILTEYMLAGLPVLANADLRCGLQYITRETGEIAEAGDWPGVIQAMLGRMDSYRPRETALARWTWPVTAAKFLSAYDSLIRLRSAA